MFVGLPENGFAISLNVTGFSMLEPDSDESVLMTSPSSTSFGSNHESVEG